MNVTRKDLDQLNAVLTVHIEAADYADQYDKELRHTRGKIEMPGFRKGMVPKGLVEKLYGTSIKAQVVNKLISDALYDYITNEKLDILGEPLANESDDQPKIDFEHDKDFDLLFDIALNPAIELNYDVEIPMYDIEVNDSMIDEEVARLCQNYGNYSTPEAAAEDDVVRGVVAEVVGENAIVNEHAVISVNHIKDEEQRKLFIGAKKDDVITFNPKKAMQDEAEIASFLGKSEEDIKDNDHDFTFTVTEISRYAAAEVGKDLFDKIYGPDVIADEAAFRARIAEDMKKQLAADEAYRFEIDAREAIMAQIKDVAMPEAFIRRLLKEKNEDMTDEKLDKEMPEILNMLRWQVVENIIADKHELRVTEEDVMVQAKDFIRMQLRNYGLANADDKLVEEFAQKSMERKEDRERFQTRAKDIKIFDALKQDVKLKPTPISLADFNKLFETKEQTQE